MKQLILILIVTLAGCMTLTEDERWNRKMDREEAEEALQLEIKRCNDRGRYVYKDRWDKMRCMSREDLHDLMRQF